MSVLRIILIVMVFACLIVGAFLVLGAKLFVPSDRYSASAHHRKVIKLKLIGYVVIMFAILFGIIQSFIA